MNSFPPCPLCTSENTYPDNAVYICPDCAHEWNPAEEASSDTSDAVVKDSNGNILTDGDSVILIKDLKVKGSSITLKKGTKAKNIRLVEGDHDVDCRIDNVSFMLKSCFLKKA